MKSMRNKKRLVSWRAKLRPSQVRRARELALRNWSQSRIAQVLGVSQSAVSMLLAGRTYRSVA